MSVPVPIRSIGLEFGLWSLVFGFWFWVFLLGAWCFVLNLETLVNRV